MTRLWTDGFEFQDLNGYCVGTSAGINTTYKRSGAASASVENSGPTSDGTIAFSFDPISEFYLRAGVYVDTSKDWPQIIWRSGSTDAGDIRFDS